MKFLPLLFFILISNSVVPDDALPTSSDIILTEVKPYRITWPKWHAMLENHKQKHAGADDSTLFTYPVASLIHSKVFTGYFFAGPDTTQSCLFITIDSAKRKAVDTIVVLGKKATPYPTIYLNQYSEIRLDGIVMTYDSIKQIGLKLMNATRQFPYVTTVNKDTYVIYESGKMGSISHSSRQYLPKDK